MKIIGILAIIPFLSALAGCAGSPVGDAIAGPEKLAQQDDAYCESIGAAHGTQNYTNCRLTMSLQRDNRHTARLGIAAAGINAAAAPPPQPTNITTICNKSGSQVVCNSN